MNKAMQEYLGNSFKLTGTLAAVATIYTYATTDYTLSQSFALNAPEDILFGFSVPYIASKTDSKSMMPYFGAFVASMIVPKICKPLRSQLVHQFSQENTYKALEETSAAKPAHRMDFHDAARQVKRLPAP